jgi:CRP/FNR family transcriptional regulator, anaerobic regulatory protein
MNSVEQLLFYLNSIHKLSPELENHLLSVVKHREILKKDFLLKAGQINKEISFIVSGLMHAYYLKEDTVVSSWFLKEGDVIVSVDSFYDQVPSYEYIRALENTSIYYIDYSELEYIYNNFMEFNFIGRVLTIKYLKIWTQQLYSIKMRSAKERYEWILQNHPELLLRVPQKLIATYLDLTAVTLSAVRHNIYKE